MRPRLSEGFFNAGTRPLPRSPPHTHTPTTRPPSHTPPPPAYSSPWLPIQKLKSVPGFCSVPIQPVAVEPTTMNSSA